MTGASFCGYKIKEHQGLPFVLIFHHNSKQGSFFKSDDETLSINTRDLFSVIGYIDNSFLIDEKFEYLLEYPDIGVNLHWSQKTNINENVTNTYYTNISVTTYGFFGLSQSYNYPKTYIDGSPGPGSNWWYSIGSRAGYQTENGIPGPRFVEEFIIVYEVNLWMKVNSVFMIDRFPRITEFTSSSLPLCWNLIYRLTFIMEYILLTC